MSNSVTFDAIARLPADGDNVAIATRAVDGGTVVIDGDTRYTISHTLLEGHRFARSGAKARRWSHVLGLTVWKGNR